MAGHDRQHHNLGSRAAEVFERVLEDRGSVLAPDDRAEGEAFWDWLGGFDPPAIEERAHVARWPMRLAVGGTLAVSLVAAAVLFPPARQLLHGGGGANPSVQQFASGRAERRVIRTSDGSTLTLAAESAVEVAFTSGERRIRLLRGEALFDVAHDKNWPFIVQAAGGEVKAVGTRFDVRLKNASDAQVTVVEGVVRVAVGAYHTGSAVEPDISRLARKGDRLSFGTHPDRSAAVGYIDEEAKADVGLATAWTRGMLYFHGEPLSQVIETVNRYATDKVVLTDPKLANTPVFGLIAQGDTSTLKELIDNPRGIRIETER